MIPDLIPFYILAATLIGSGLGFFTAAILAARKIDRLEKDTWAAANAYYERKASPGIRRL